MDAVMAFADAALDGEVEGIHVFCDSDIFAAVYTTNVLMRACDVLVTKPGELSFYPVPKLMIRHVGGHEVWGAIRAAEVGDSTFECAGRRSWTACCASSRRPRRGVRHVRAHQIRRQSRHLRRRLPGGAPGLQRIVWNRVKTKPAPSRRARREN
jgi:hypothetical protein